MEMGSALGVDDGFRGVKLEVKRCIIEVFKFANSYYPLSYHFLFTCKHDHFLMP